MTVDQLGVVDYTGVERETGKVVLTIVDQLSWDDVEAHVETLQEKVNRYIGFVENGEIYESYPNSKGRSVAVALMLWYPRPESEYVDRFFAAIRDVLAGIDIEFRIQQIPDGPDATAKI